MDVNISRTAREADSVSVAPSGAAPRTCCCELPGAASGTGGPSNLRQCGNNYALGNVHNDFNFSNLLWKNEVNSSGFRLLVGAQQLESLRVLDIHIGQRPPGVDCVANTFVSCVVAYTRIHSNSSRGLHAPSNGFSVEKMLVLGSGLERMAESMSKVQHAPQVTLFFVGRNNFGFQSHRFGNGSGHEIGVLAQVFDWDFGQLVEQGRLANDAGLHRFVHSRAELTL